jgi:hypothetical protein
MYIPYEKRTPNSIDTSYTESKDLDDKKKVVTKKKMKSMQKPWGEMYIDE